MTVDLHQRKLLSPLIISLLIHLVGLKTLEFLPKNFLTSKTIAKQTPKKPIQVRSISRKELKKYRTVGVRNGKKSFSMPIKSQVSPTKPLAPDKKVPAGSIKIQKARPKKITAKKSKAPIKSKSTLSLNSLRVKTKPEFKTKVLNSKMRTLEEEKNENSKLTVTAENPVTYQRTKEAQTDVLKQLAASPDNAKVLRKTGFHMQLEPPEGISEDELNSMEKIYYSFQKRTFKAYVGSFLKTYRQTLIDHPGVRETLKNDLHRLAARVVFDSEGNIMSIKILRSSQSDDVHNLFEETLKDIRKLPNPPKDLIQRDGQFTIYYQLKIN